MDAELRAICTCAFPSRSKIVLVLLTTLSLVILVCCVGTGRWVMRKKRKFIEQLKAEGLVLGEQPPKKISLAGPYPGALRLQVIHEHV